MRENLLLVYRAGITKSIAGRHGRIVVAIDARLSHAPSIDPMCVDVMPSPFEFQPVFGGSRIGLSTLSTSRYDARFEFENFHRPQTLSVPRRRVLRKSDQIAIHTPHASAATHLAPVRPQSPDSQDALATGPINSSA